MSTLFLTRKDVRGLLGMREVIDVVEQALGDWAIGRATMPPKVYLNLPKGDIRAMPAAIEGAMGVKWANVHPENPKRGLPSVFGIIVYNDPETGYPLAVMDATEITSYRTAAVAAIASKYLAQPRSHRLGIIGAGQQALYQIKAQAEVFDFDSIKVADIRDEAVVRLIARAGSEYPLRACSAEEAAASDILCTITTSREPVVLREWIRPGTHINAIGADAPGKQELDPDILKDSIVVVDDIRQASSSGEINVPIRNGLYSADRVFANLGELVAGVKVGKPIYDSTITVFDSTGVAVVDVATAKLVYTKAVQRKAYLSLDFVEEP